MEFRFLGNSGLKVSAISYGNWVTHGSQVEADQATACVRAALEAGITTFDTRTRTQTVAPRRFWAMR
jgi:aryl-alcohol dehydrogenase-like predicted oxidoreductase